MDLERMDNQFLFIDDGVLSGYVQKRKLYIIDRSPAAMLAAQHDARRRPRSTCCLNQKVYQLITILVRLDVSSHYVEEIGLAQIRFYLIERHPYNEIAALNDQQVRQCYGWWRYTGRRMGPKKEDVVHIIQEHLAKLGRLIIYPDDN
jgi:hypothetical protein